MARSLRGGCILIVYNITFLFYNYCNALYCVVLYCIYCIVWYCSLKMNNKTNRYNCYTISVIVIVVNVSI